MVDEGLEPPKLKTPDLQSGPVAALVIHQRNLRDSNPRRILTLGGLVNRCLKPLGQDSNKGGGNRTLIYGFGDRHSTVELRQSNN